MKGTWDLAAGSVRMYLHYHTPQHSNISISQDSLEEGGGRGRRKGQEEGQGEGQGRGRGGAGEETKEKEEWGGEGNEKGYRGGVQ